MDHYGRQGAQHGAVHRLLTARVGRPARSTAARTSALRAPAVLPPCAGLVRRSHGCVSVSADGADEVSVRADRACGATSPFGVSSGKWHAT